MGHLKRCLPGLCSLLALSCGRLDEAPYAGANLLFISPDTLRADHTTVHSYARPTTPNLERWATEALVFDRAVSASCQTTPSHMTMFTGLWPAAHGVVQEFLDAPNDEETAEAKAAIPARPLPPDVPTLAEVLSDRGYATAAITGGGGVARAFGSRRGFDTYTAVQEPAATRVDEGIAWLEDRETDAPFFLFLHTYQVHTPYKPPEEVQDLLRSHPVVLPFDQDQLDRQVEAVASEFGNATEMVTTKVRQVEWLVRRYDEEVLYLDQEFQRLWAYLDASGLAGNTIVVVVSDHGEEFFEHGTHGHYQLSEEVVRVLTMIRFPDGFRAGERV